MSKPRDRIGALPFPGLLTLYSSADANHLGEHRYEWMPRLYPPDESQGIIYTRRAGFVDVAHIRITLDTIRYCSDRLREGLREHRSVVALPTIEGSIFYVELHYSQIAPKNAAQDADQEQFTDELAIRLGQRVAFMMMTWHEILTWYGHRTVAFIDEQPSAFTWDDTASHYVALQTSDRVLREKTQASYDDRVTVALREELKELGALPPAQTDKAAYAVEGKWWAKGKPLKRDVDIGLFEPTFTPWVIPQFSSGPGDPEIFHLPALKDVRGRDCSGCYALWIDPKVHVTDRLRDVIPGRPTLFDGYRDVQTLMQVMRQQMSEQFAADFDRPWPAVADRGEVAAYHEPPADTTQPIR